MRNFWIQMLHPQVRDLNKQWDPRFHFDTSTGDFLKFKNNLMHAFPHLKAEACPAAAHPRAVAHCTMCGPEGGGDGDDDSLSARAVQEALYISLQPPQLHALSASSFGGP